MLTLSLTTPIADDRGIVVSLEGPGPISEIVSPADGLVLHSRPSGTGFKAAVFGSLANGALVRFSVPDVNKASSYRASVLDVSDGSNALRSSTAGYAVTVAKQ